MTITETTTVAEVASALPASVRIFQRHGIDFCCGGKTPLAAACRDHGIAFGDMVEAIEAASTQSPDVRDWTAEPLHAIADHIVATYHEPLRAELPRLEAMAAKVARVHGANAPHLLQVDAIVSELSAELWAHMRKEEMVLFPAIRTLERGAQAGVPVASAVSVMEHEHDHAGELLSQLRTLTDGYAPPDWACQTFRALYHGLAELESTMHVHVHLENNILFPRALGLAAAA